MSARLPLTSRDKKKIFGLYAKGLKPAEIAIELRSMNLTPRQVTNILYRAGWTKKKSEIAQAKRESAAEIVERAREETATELEPLLKDIATGLKNDGARLRDGWDLVDDAAGASALQRAKGLHLNRVLRFHNLDKPDAHASRAANLSLVYAHFEEANAAPAEVVVMDVPATAPSARGDDGLNLDFDDAAG